MKWVALLGVVILGGIIIWRSTSQNNSGEKVELTGGVKEVVTSPTPAQPLAIETFRQRQFAAVIKKETVVREAEKFTSWKVSFESDGLKQYALLNIPKGASGEKGWPVVVVNHGYIPPEQYSTENSYINTSAYFANAGFLVIKPDYRGHDESEGETETLAARINYGVDVLNLIEGIKTLPEADSSKMFMYGHSMGGDVSLRVAEVCGGCIKAMSLWAPAVTDWPESSLYFARKNNPERIKKLTEQLTGNFKVDDYDKIAVIKNLNWVEVPVLIHHGTADESVPFSWGQDLHSKLSALGKEVTFYSYPGDTHDIPKNWGVALGRDVEFFRGQL